jgi:hypothetical protein
MVNFRRAVALALPALTLGANAAEKSTVRRDISDPLASTHYLFDCNNGSLNQTNWSIPGTSHQTPDCYDTFVTHDTGAIISSFRSPTANAGLGKQNKPSLETELYFCEPGKSTRFQILPKECPPEPVPSNARRQANNPLSFLKSFLKGS